MFLATRAGALLRTMVLCVCLLLAPAAHADLNVASGGIVSLSSGAMDLACTDITIVSTGILRLGSAPVTGVRNVTIQPGAILDFGTGSITVAGSFTNNNGILPNLGPGSIILVANLACAPNGPSFNASSTPVPALGAGSLALLGFILAGIGMLVTRRRT
jgi:hypothetical protein